MGLDTGLFVPWRDDALLSEESVYSLWNKVSWFCGIAPAALVRRCRGSAGNSYASPKEIRYDQPDRWMGYLDNHALLPRIGGRPACKVLDSLYEASKVEVPDMWLSPLLRICKKCIAGGIHLRVHQHLAVDRCPIHGLPLYSSCSACGADLKCTSAGEKAFCCRTCGRCLLRAGEIQFDFPDAVRSELARVGEEFHKWLWPLNAGARLQGMATSRGGRLDHALAHLDVRFIALAALRGSSVQAPAWLATPLPLQGILTIAAIRTAGTPLAKSMRQATNVSRWNTLESDRPNGPTRDATKTEGPLEKGALAVGYRHALRRVTANYLRLVRADHSQCLDTPYRIAGEVWEHDDPFKFEILGCCPIALGFWLWRKRAGSRFTPFGYLPPNEEFHDMGIRDACVKLDLLLYAVERSHLHACVLVAHHCSERWRETGEYEQSVKMLEQWIYPSLSPKRRDLAWLDFGCGKEWNTFVRVDATRLIKRIVCPASEPYYRSLRRKLRAIPIVNRTTMKIEYLNMEWRWKDRALAQGEPFTAMTDDWVFLGDKCRRSSENTVPMDVEATAMTGQHS